MSSAVLQAVLRTERLTRTFSGFLAVDAVDFAVRAGEIRAIIGPNGAGKSTFFRLLSGDVRPSSGRIWFEGREVAGLPAHRMSRIGVGKSYQVNNAFPKLTVRENIRIAAQPSALDFRFWAAYADFPALAEKTDRILETVGLATQRERLAGELSYGDRRRLELGMALGTDPRLLLLDEPTAGMTPEETAATVALIRDIAQQRTVILVEHKMDVVMTIADRVTVLHQGRILAEGEPDVIRSNREVQTVYLGIH